MGRSECRASSSSMTLRKSGERCWTTTKAIPGEGGRLEKNCSRDSRPPADAPMPTTRNVAGALSGLRDVEIDSELTERSSSLKSRNKRVGAGSQSPPKSGGPSQSEGWGGLFKDEQYRLIRSASRLPLRTKEGNVSLC